MKKMEKIQVYSIGLCNLSVCVESSVSMEAITKQVNKEYPTGLDHGWKLSKRKTFSDGTDMPCACDTHPKNRKHYLFNC